MVTSSTDTSTSAKSQQLQQGLPAESNPRTRQVSPMDSLGSPGPLHMPCLCTTMCPHRHHTNAMWRHMLTYAALIPVHNGATSSLTISQMYPHEHVHRHMHNAGKNKMHTPNCYQDSVSNTVCATVTTRGQRRTVSTGASDKVERSPYIGPERVD